MKHSRDSSSPRFRRRYRAALTIPSFLLLFLAGTASALDPHRMISQYAHTVWKVQDGFARGPAAICFDMTG